MQGRTSSRALEIVSVLNFLMTVAWREGDEGEI